MANAYSWIIFKNKAITGAQMKQCQSFIQFKSKIVSNERANRNFYDTLILFSAKVLKDAFDPSELMKLEEEINRLYRSNAFNITERKIHLENQKKAYPQLAEVNVYTEVHDDREKRILLRQKVPKDWRKAKFQRNKSEIRPFYQKLSAHSALQSRSPMVSLIFPSLKDKIKLFQDESKKKESVRAQTTAYVKRADLEKIVESETRKRQTNNWNF